MSDKNFTIDFAASHPSRVFSIKGDQTISVFSDNGFITIEVDGNFFAAYPSHLVTSIESYDVSERYVPETASA